jgi:hypothetical protein
MIRFCAIFFLFLAVCPAEDRHDWKSVSALKPGDLVRVSLRTGKSVTGPFRNWTPEGASVGAGTVARNEVKKVERLRNGGRLKHTAMGAAIGFGAGFAIGAAAGGCHPGEFLCVGRGEAGAIVSGVGAAIGAAIGAALPAHRKDAIYIGP